jgi:glycosyltransferase involved in cell wall biosynthesis
VVLSPAYRDQQLKKYIDSSLFSNLLPKIHVIPNAVNDFWLENSPLQQKVIGDTIEIIFVGKLRPNKNLKAVISACNILHSRGKKVRLTICGDGELKEQLLGQVYEFEFNYLGFINDKEELRKIYNKAHILIVPSFMESFGLVYVEAMSQGLGVIYTKGQGFDGYFEDGIVGYATDPNDHEGIAYMVEKISDNFHQISINAIREAQEFSWNNTALKLVKLYRQAI